MFRAAFWKRAFTSELYVTVLVAIVLGAVFGLLWPEAGASLEPLGDVFIFAIQMLIGPVVFCTIVTGIASAGRAGRRRARRHQGARLLRGRHHARADHRPRRDERVRARQRPAREPRRPQALRRRQGLREHRPRRALVRLPRRHRAGRARSAPSRPATSYRSCSWRSSSRSRCAGSASAACRSSTAIESLGEIVFGMVGIVMYAGAVRRLRRDGVRRRQVRPRHALEPRPRSSACSGSPASSSASSCSASWRGCAGLNVLKIYRYFKDELLITLGTANYEAVMPRLITKLEHLGAPKRIVGLVVPSGLRVQRRRRLPLPRLRRRCSSPRRSVSTSSLWQQIALLAVFLVTSKGSAGVAGAGFVILAATLSTTGTVPVVGIMLILGVDRFLSTMRGLVSLTGQMLGSLTWSAAGRASSTSSGRAPCSTDGRSPSEPSRRRARASARWRGGGHDPPAPPHPAAATPPTASAPAAAGADARSTERCCTARRSPTAGTALLGAIRGARRCPDDLRELVDPAHRRVEPRRLRVGRPRAGRPRRAGVDDATLAVGCAMAARGPRATARGSMALHRRDDPRHRRCPTTCSPRCATHFDDRQLVELTATVGAYNMVSRVASVGAGAWCRREARGQGRDRHRRGQRRRRLGQRPRRGGAVRPRGRARARRRPGRDGAAGDAGRSHEGGVAPARCDVTDPQQVAGMVAACREAFGARRRARQQRRRLAPRRAGRARRGRLALRSSTSTSPASS